MADVGLTWSKSCFHLGNNPESLSQCDHHISNLRHTEPPCKTQRPCPVAPAHYSTTPIGSLASSHNQYDAEYTGMDAQQLIEFVVDDAPTVAQLLTQVFLPHLYLLSPLIHISRRDYYSSSGDLDVSAVTLTFICKIVINSSDIALSITTLRIADRGLGTPLT